MLGGWQVVLNNLRNCSDAWVSTLWQFRKLSKQSENESLIVAAATPIMLYITQNVSIWLRLIG